MNTHKVSITVLATGETFTAEFPGLGYAEAWRDNMVSMRNLDLVGGKHFLPNDDLMAPKVIDPKPNGMAVITEIDTKEAQIQVVWEAADAFALASVDRNERERYLGWLSDPTCSQDRKNKILAVLEWLDAIWAQYYTMKARIASGRRGSFSPDTLPPCPYSFFDIAST